MKRAEAKKQIRDTVLERLRTATQSDQRLHGIRAVYDGDRVRHVPDLPALFVVREIETVVQERLHTTMEYNLSLLVILADDDPEEGLEQAEWWADEAADIATEDHHLGLSFVNDARLVRGLPVSVPHTERRKVGSASVIAVTYTVMP